MLKLKQTSVVPPDEYRFTFREDGWKARSFSRDAWYAQIKKHADDNGYTLPENWTEVADDQLCQLLPPGWCFYPDGSAPRAFIQNRFTLDDAIHGTKVLIAFVKAGFPIVPQEVAEARAKTCASCYALLSVPGCDACTAISNVVADACGGRATKADGILGNKVCGICHCSARAAVHIPLDVIEAGVTDAMKEQFAMVPWCWRRFEP